MNRSASILVAQVGRLMKSDLVTAAECLGVEPSSLVRALLSQGLEDLRGHVLGQSTEEGALIQLERPAHVELHLVRLNRRSRARP